MLRKLFSLFSNRTRKLFAPCPIFLSPPPTPTIRNSKLFHPPKAACCFKLFHFFASLFRFRVLASRSEVCEKFFFCFFFSHLTSCGCSRTCCRKSPICKRNLNFRWSENVRRPPSPSSVCLSSYCM